MYNAKKNSSAVQKQAAGIGRTDGIECWEEAESTTFMVRGQNYMQDKKKVPSEHSIYRRAAAHSFVATQAIHFLHSRQSPSRLPLTS